ncbi:Fur family transcriptional regulator [Spelaeicoccus albus]|uniref:Fur family ferric uptake transcriptional regulator n=1 Tax=Spelaeicoccus albus TaxID=1280376 RepID=A0A7Z0D2T4_9MICO|nr:Fur family transcriptional regulator [Spelaeicoccus albus]NYI67839.1 Fur family ferric uptake transcriptional regulator [Spelaeicoccus albus]
MPTDFADRLRSSGLRVTAARLAVMAELDNAPHSDAEALGDGVRARLGTVSTAAVYDALNAFTKAGLARKLDPSTTAAALYELHHSDNHHHLVCRLCREIVDVPCVTGAAPCLTPSDTAGFAVDAADITFRGICPDCLAREA